MRNIVFENRHTWCSKHHINKKALKQTLQKISSDHGFHVEHMSYIIVSDAQLLQMNRTYLKHDYHTDIITFDLHETPLTINGEAYISKDTIQSNALRFGCTVAQEFSRVAIHGLLHLCGFKDKTPNEKTEMRLQEEKYLNYLLELQKNTNS